MDFSTCFCTWSMWIILTLLRKAGPVESPGPKRPGGEELSQLVDHLGRSQKCRKEVSNDLASA